MASVHMKIPYLAHIEDVLATQNLYIFLTHNPVFTHLHTHQAHKAEHGL